MTELACQPHPSPREIALQQRTPRWVLLMMISMGAVMMSEGNAAGQAQGERDEETIVVSPSESLKAYPNLPLPTAGGNQMWTDYRNLAGWRIQQNSLTGHWRLLDPKDIRRCWGSREACEEMLRKTTVNTAAVSSQDHVIILLHGLMRTRRSMDPLAEHLEEQSDAQVIRFSYASTRFGIAEHAGALRELVDGLPGEPRIDFVGHSMGNIVVRHAIGDWQREGPAGQAVLSRLGRVVMLGPPNNGAAIARRLSEVGLFETLVGQGGMQLGPQWRELEKRLAVPPCPFAIVAGDLSEKVPQNPLVDGASDFVVSVEEAKLEGATEFHQLSLLHSVMMNDRKVHRIVEKFLAS